MAGLLLRTSDALDRLCRWGALAGVVLMVALTAIQVVARYVLADPPAWTEEAARYAMIWSGMLGATVAFRWRRDPVLVKLRFVEQGRGLTAGRTLRALAAVLFLAPIWLYSLFGPNFDIARGFLARSAERTAEVIGLPMVWFTCIIPIAITVIFVHVAAQLAGARVDSGSEP
jgi:TRAP-type C4-dicarboxylate transport system permease small subunit